MRRIRTRQNRLEEENCQLRPCPSGKHFGKATRNSSRELELNARTGLAARGPFSPRPRPVTGGAIMQQEAHSASALAIDGLADPYSLERCCPWIAEEDGIHVFKDVRAHLEEGPFILKRDERLPCAIVHRDP